MATKTLKRFILIAVLCLFALPAQAAITCTVTSGVTNCTLTGPGSDLSGVSNEGIQFGIIYYVPGPYGSASVVLLGDIPPALQPNPGSGGCSMFSIGDGVTATDLTSESELVSVMGEVRVRTNAVLTLGREEDGYGVLGSAWSFRNFPGQGYITLVDGGTLNMYASMITIRWSESGLKFERSPGGFYPKNSIINGPWERGKWNNLSFLTGLTSSIEDVYVSGFGILEMAISPDPVDDFHFHNSNRGYEFWQTGNLTMRGFKLTDVEGTPEVKVYNDNRTVTLLNPLTMPADIVLANNTFKVDWNVDVFVGDKNTEPESGVSVVLNQNSLVDGSSGNSVFLCTTSHTSTADTTPITGADWADYWRVYFTGSVGGCTEIPDVDGGDHRTGVAYVVDDEVFNVLSTSGGTIAQQQVTFKKWTTTSEYLDTWLHRLKLTKAGKWQSDHWIYINEQKDLWYEVEDRYLRDSHSRRYQRESDTQIRNR